MVAKQKKPQKADLSTFHRTSQYAECLMRSCTYKGRGPGLSKIRSPGADCSHSEWSSYSDSTDPECFLNRYPTLRDKRMILFMGRIHFKKGLDILVQSWARVAKGWPDAHLVLAGPDFEDTRASIEKLVADYGLGS